MSTADFLGAQNIYQAEEMEHHKKFGGVFRHFHTFEEKSRHRANHKAKKGAMRNMLDFYL